jgi:2-amino-4-hydroxy-6-hydroxymethyldihydropteridine diphosphokinase
VVTAYIGVGANLGDRAGQIHAAATAVGRLAKTRLTGMGPVLETDPVGGPAQPRYLNTVLAVETALSAGDLLAALGAIENRLGRVRTVRDGPRTIDLDILLYGDAVIDTPSLTVPHPRMTERAFVLDPLAVLAPDAVHPVLLKSIAELREERNARAAGTVQVHRR